MENSSPPGLFVRLLNMWFNPPGNMWWNPGNVFRMPRMTCVNSPYAHNSNVNEIIHMQLTSSFDKHMQKWMWYDLWYDYIYIYKYIHCIYQLSSFSNNHLSVESGLGDKPLIRIMIFHSGCFFSYNRNTAHSWWKSRCASTYSLQQRYPNVSKYFGSPPPSFHLPPSSHKKTPNPLPRKRFSSKSSGSTSSPLMFFFLNKKKRGTWIRSNHLWDRTKSKWFPPRPLRGRLPLLATHPGRKPLVSVKKMTCKPCFKWRLFFVYQVRANDGLSSWKVDFGRLSFNRLIDV